MSCTAFTQETAKDYQGDWEGFLSQSTNLNFNITVEVSKSNSFHVTMENPSVSINKVIQSSGSKDYFQISINKDLQFKLQFADDKEKLIGFIRSGGLMYHINLNKTKNNIYKGIWKPFMVDDLEPKSVFLAVENYDDGSFAAYPFFGDQRFRGTYTYDFKRVGDTIFFRDFNTGMKFQAKLLGDEIQLEILFAGVVIAKANLSRSKSNWKFGQANPSKDQNLDTPGQLNDDWTTASIQNYKIDPAPLHQMIKDINTSKLENTHSVLIAKKGKLVVETYYDGHNRNIPHDMRSAAKSISSAIIGIAIDDKILENSKQKLFDCVPEKYQYTKDDLKSKVTIHDLLTMSSGLDVSGQASEDSYQNSDNWLKTVLEAPMKNNPGSYGDYGSANPFLLGVCLNEKLNMPLEVYMDQKLFAPLGISNYILNTEETQTMPYFGGGMLLTSRDILKFGQLYLDKGKWKGNQIVSENWIKESFKKHNRLEDTSDKNEYGYQWWHDTYLINGKGIETIEARGAGGQFIFIIPALESVVVITSGNYRNRKGNQPRDILQEYILPAINK